MGKKSKGADFVGKIPKGVWLLISLVVASIRIHSRMFIVVLVGTAFITIPTALFKSLLENTRFIIVQNSFRCRKVNNRHIYKYI